MTEKKSLQAWYNEGRFTYDQKAVINKFGVNDYYPKYTLQDLRKLWYWNDILLRNAYKLEKSFGDQPVYQMNFFSAWWNNNLIIVISGEDVYLAKLIVYEMPHREMNEIFEVFSVGLGTLYEVKNKTSEWIEKLKEDNPILCGICTMKLNVIYFDDYNSPAFPVSYGYENEKIKRIEVDFNSARWNPDAHFKPLDIAMVFNNEWVHACVYLGWDRDNNEYKVCHARYDSSLNKDLVRIESWEKFLFGVITPYQRKIIRYHPVIAFKKTDEIIKHIAKCVEGEENYYSRSNLKKGPFRIRSYGNYENSNNCENFTNRCVLGLDFSELNERKKDASSRARELNIQENLGKTNYQLDKLTSYIPWTTINKIKEHRRSSGYENFEIMRDGIKMDACIEVQPKTNIFKRYG